MAPGCPANEGALGSGAASDDLDPAPLAAPAPRDGGPCPQGQLNTLDGCCDPEDVLDDQHCFGADETLGWDQGNELPPPPEPAKNLQVRHPDDEDGFDAQTEQFYY